MPVTYTARNRDLSLSLSGEIDHHGAKGLMRELTEEVDAVLPRRLTVDCSRVTFMDSSGIAVLLRLWKRMEALGGSIRVTGLREQPARVLRAAGLERLITIEFE